MRFFQKIVKPLGMSILLFGMLALGATPANALPEDTQNTGEVAPQNTHEAAPNSPATSNTVLQPATADSNADNTVSGEDETTTPPLAPSEENESADTVEGTTNDAADTVKDEVSSEKVTNNEPYENSDTNPDSEEAEPIIPFDQGEESEPGLKETQTSDEMEQAVSNHTDSSDSSLFLSDDLRDQDPLNDDEFDGFASRAKNSQVNEIEPNNTTSQAQKIALDSVVSGQFGPEHTGGFRPSDHDFYKIDVAKAGRLILDLRFSADYGADSSFNLEVVNAAGVTIMSRQIQSHQYDGSALRSFFIPVGTGVHYIHVSARVGESSVFNNGKYTLQPIVKPENVEVEPNDSTATANRIKLGSKIFGSLITERYSSDSDYYRLVLNERTPVNLDFKYSCSIGTSAKYRLQVLDNAGTELLNETLGEQHCDGTSIKQLTLSLPAGNSYVHVFGNSRHSELSGRSYNLTVSTPPKNLTAAPTPKISGKLQVGQTLKAVTGTWKPAPVSLKYQWLRNGKAISGATKANYKLVAADRGEKISVTVTGSKSGYKSQTKTSDQSTVANELINRVSGADRFATSAAISRANFKPGVAVAYIASGTNFPDALSAAPVAGKNKSPILLVQHNSISHEVQTELKRLKAKKIVVLGSSSAVSNNVQRLLNGFTAGSVTRVQGSDRFATSASISKSNFNPGVNVVYIASGTNFPDALSAAPVAGKNKAPILLVQQGGIPNSVHTELKRLKPKKIVILGSTNAVSSSVESRLHALTNGSVTRSEGPDRFQTSAAISRANFRPGVPVVYVASGTNFPDALSAAPVAGKNAAPILLVQQGSVPASIEAELKRLRPKKIVVLGSSDAVSQNVYNVLSKYTP